MPLNIVAAVAAGLVGTAVMTLIMMVAPMMGMPKMDIPGLLGSMFGAPGSKTMGTIMHFIMGVIFAIVYTVLFSVITGLNVVLLGIVLGVVHWLVVGLVMGMMPMMHAGIKSGDVAAPGLYMSGSGGLMGFVGGLMGHIVFGPVVGLVYRLIAGGFGA